MTTDLQPLITVEDLEDMPEDDGNRYEVIEGELFVSCSPGLTHQRVLVNVVFLIRSYLERDPIGEVVFTPGLMLSKYSGVIPDVVFFRHEKGKEIISGERLTGPPDLVIEILSPGSENVRRDRTAKFQLYAKHGVPEYWIIDPVKRTVEIFRPEHDSFALIASSSGTDQITTPALPGFRCKVCDLFKQ